MPVDAVLVRRRLRALERSLRILRGLRSAGRRAFLTDEVVQDRAERHAQLLAQVCADIALHILAGTGAAAPETYAEALSAVAAAGVIPDFLGARLAAAVRLRNILVHGYLDVDHGRLFDELEWIESTEDSVVAQSARLTLDYGLDDTTSMLFTFRSGASGYLGTVIATAEGWRMQVCGAKGWAMVGSIPHLHTWSLTTCMVNAQPTVIDYPQGSSERAELEGFADAIEGRMPYACLPDDAVHGVAVLEAVVKSARSGQRELIM